MSKRSAQPEPAASVFQPYDYQKWLAANTARLLIVCWSRQVGKSMGAALLVNNDILGVEAEGRRTTWTLISRSLPQARELAIKVRDVARAVTVARKMLQPTMTETGEHEERQVELLYPGGSRVIVVSGNPDAAAGYTGNVLWDEVALTKRAAELFGTAFPVISRENFRFIMMSTPRPGFFRQMWDEAGKADSLWARNKMTIHEAVAQGCPQDPEFLRRGLRNNEIKWRQEYLCEFVDDEICWLPWELLVGCTDPHATVEPADADGAIYAGWDVARWNHLSVLWVVEKTGLQMLTRAVVVMQRMPFEDQLKLIEKTLRKYPRFTRLCVDAGGMGEMPAEQAVKKWGYRVEPVKFTSDVKAVLAGDLRRVMEERSFRIPDDDAVRDDLYSIRCTTTSAGNKRFEGEVAGSHADRFWAASLAVHAGITNTVVPFKFEPTGSLMFGGKLL